MPEILPTIQRMGKYGEEYIKKYLEGRGYKVEVSHRNGSDLIAKKGKKSVAIEVKTTGSEYGIPDMNSTEFVKENGHWIFVADYLYILRLDNTNKSKQIDILSRGEINKYEHSKVVRIRTNRLQTAIKNKTVICRSEKI